MYVRLLNPADVEAFTRLRLRALREEPMSFSSDPEDQLSTSAEEIIRRLTPSANAFVLGAIDSNQQLVGMVGVFRETPAKHAHKAFMWGVYVAPEYRKRGLGERLVRAAIDQVPEALPGVQILGTSVFLSAPAARALYPRCGFVSWGIEARSAKVGGQYIAEEYFCIELLYRAA